MSAREYNKTVKKLNRIRLIFFWTAIGLAMLTGMMFFIHNREYTTYSVQSVTLSEDTSVDAVFSFRDGNLLVTSDSLSYLDGTQVKWTTPGIYGNPRFTSCGDYFVIYSQGSFSCTVGNQNGVIGEVSAQNPICGCSVSSGGTLALATQKDDVAYITYYDPYGRPENVEIKTVIDSVGFPVDFALSPDKMRLLALYYTVRNGVGESRIVVYDFQNGTEDNSYIVMQYEDYYETDDFFFECGFFNKDKAYALSKNKVEFLSGLSKAEVERKTLQTDGLVSALQSQSELILVNQNEEGNVCTIYKDNGKEKNSFLIREEYDRFIANDRYILFWKDSRILFYNRSGIFRYAGTLTFSPYQIGFTGNRSLFINDGAGFTVITLK